MIKANELRIGNWVFMGDSYKMVYSVSWNEILVCDSNLRSSALYSNDGHKLEPISLTPEILEKCGFIKGKRFYTDVDSFYKDIYFFSNNWFHRKSMGETAIILSRYIDYLHQLQNFYFALTGEELEINL